MPRLSTLESPKYVPNITTVAIPEVGDRKKRDFVFLPYRDLPDHRWRKLETVYSYFPDSAYYRYSALLTIIDPIRTNEDAIPHYHEGEKKIREQLKEEMAMPISATTFRTIAYWCQLYPRLARELFDPNGNYAKRITDFFEGSGNKPKPFSAFAEAKLILPNIILYTHFSPNTLSSVLKETETYFAAKEYLKFLNLSAMCRIVFPEEYQEDTEKLQTCWEVLDGEFFQKIMNWSWEQIIEGLAHLTILSASEIVVDEHGLRAVFNPNQIVNKEIVLPPPVQRSF